MSLYKLRQKRDPVTRSMQNPCSLVESMDLWLSQHSLKIYHAGNYIESVSTCRVKHRIVQLSCLVLTCSQLTTHSLANRNIPLTSTSLVMADRRGIRVSASGLIPAINTHPPDFVACRKPTVLYFVKQSRILSIENVQMIFKNIQVNILSVLQFH